MRTPSAYACTEYYRQHALFQLSNDVNSVQGGPKRAAGSGALAGWHTDKSAPQSSSVDYVVNQHTAGC